MEDKSFQEYGVDVFDFWFDRFMYYKCIGNLSQYNDDNQYSNNGLFNCKQVKKYNVCFNYGIGQCVFSYCLIGFILLCSSLVLVSIIIVVIVLVSRIIIVLVSRIIIVIIGISLILR